MADNKRKPEIQAPHDAPASAWKQRVVVVQILLILLLGILAYSNTFDVPFHFDDRESIVKNPSLRDLGNFWPPSGLRWFGRLTFALNYYTGGLDVAGYHAVNLSIHLFTALLFYHLLFLTLNTPAMHRMTQGRDNGGPALRWRYGFIPFCASLLFVAHPIQTQAVTYIVQRYASLATCMYVLSLVLYVRSRNSGLLPGAAAKTRSWVSYGFSILTAVLAMKTKEIALTLPLIVLLYELAFFDGPLRSRLPRLLWFVLPPLIIPLSAISLDLPGQDLAAALDDSARAQTSASRLDYLLTQFPVIITYLRFLILPVGQSIDHNQVLRHSFFELPVLLSCAMHLTILGAAGVLIKKARTAAMPHANLIAFGVLWFYITLMVESSIVPIRDVMVEHRLYLPSIGIFLAAVAGFSAAASRAIDKLRAFRIALGSVLLLAIVLSSATYARNSVWRSKIALWEDAVAKNPAASRPHENLGVAYREQERYDDALREYLIARDLEPLMAENHYDLGNLYLSLGRSDDAAHEYEWAVRLKPGLPFAHFNLGVYYEGKGRLVDASREFARTAAISPGSPYAHYELGKVSLLLGDRARAKSEFEITLRLFPQHQDARAKLEQLR